MGKRDYSNLKKIVVRCPNWVGDAVMATPALHSIRNGFPHAEITLVVKSRLGEIYRGGPWFHRMLEYQPKGEHKGWLGFLRFCRVLRGERFDLAVILPNSFSSALMMALVGVPKRVGYRLDRRGWLLTHAVEVLREKERRRRPAPMVDYYLGLCKAMGLKSSSETPRLFTTHEEEEEARQFCRRKGISRGDSIVALNPGASFGPSKMWRSDYFAQVGDTLARRYKCRILILCGPGEENVAEGIERAMETAPVNTADHPVALGLLKVLIKRCDLLITTDTGPRHFAVALGRPVVVIMGPTDRRYTEKNLEKTVVLQEEVECGPCHLKECPIDHRCMERISPERVVAAAEGFLSGVSKDG